MINNISSEVLVHTSSIQDWSHISVNTLRVFTNSILESAPYVIGAVIILIIGWLLAKLVSVVIRKILNRINLTKIESSINETKVIKNSDINVNIALIVSKYIYWVIILLFFVIATDSLGWNDVSKEIGNLFRYLPKLFSALVIFLVGAYIAKIIKQVLSASFSSVSFGGGSFISNIAYYIIIIIVSVTALNQAGINTDLISSNLNIIIGSVLFSFALGFGIASKDILKNILNSFYSKQNFQVGQYVKMGSIKGEIIAINNVLIFLKTKDTIESIPTSLFMESTVTILTNKPSEDEA